MNLMQAIRVQGAAAKFSQAAVRTTQALSASLKIEIPERAGNIVSGEGLRPDRVSGSIVIDDVHFACVRARVRACARACVCAL